jgi:hypothetical protein
MFSIAAERENLDEGRQTNFAKTSEESVMEILFFTHPVYAVFPGSGMPSEAILDVLLLPS